VLNSFIKICLLTRLPSNLWPIITRKCVHLVTCGHVTDGGHIIRSVISGKPHSTRKPHGSVCYRTGVMVSEVLHCRNRDFLPFCSCDLDLDPMTCICELDPYSLDIYRMCKYKLPTSRLSVSHHLNRQTHRQTDRQTGPRSYTTQLRG